MNVWKMVKNRLAFFGGLPVLRISSGLMRRHEPGDESSNAENALKAWVARMFRSARKRMRGRRVASRLKFQRAWKSFQAI
jgi:hypothetical protein